MKNREKCFIIRKVASLNEQKIYQLKLDYNEATYKWGDLMKKIKIITISILLAIVLLIVISPIVSATITPGDYAPTLDSSGVGKIAGIANPIIGTIQTIGIVVAAITIIVLGIKYMAGSIDEKAEYKKTMIPYLIGAVLVVAITQIVGVIAKLVDNINA